MLEKQYLYTRFVVFFLNLFGPAINYIVVNNRYGLEVNVKAAYLQSVLASLKSQWFLQFKTVCDLVGIDYPAQTYRFRVAYLLLSYTYTFRIVVSVSVKDRQALDSATTLYPGTGWLEREVWDFFGIYFQGNRDLRRILTDYGFSGYPLRKDFPLTGFYEVMFDDKKHQVIYQPVSLAQEYRDFSHQNPWRLNN